MNKKCEIVCLGTNCLPRTILTLRKIKPSRAEGELTCPFDLAMHPIDVVINSLENNFETVFDDIYYYRDKAKKFDFRRKHSYWAKPDGTKFNHDNDCRENDLDKFIQRYKNRIENLNKILSSDTPILFVIFLKNESERKSVNKLYDVLKHRVNVKFELAVLDFNGIVSEYYYPEVKVLNLPIPCDNYFDTWYRRKFRKSKIGCFLEICVCEFVQNIIDTEF